MIVSNTTRCACIFALLGALLGLAPDAAGQSVSPGPLSQGHKDLEGIKNCTQCHELGERVINAGRCLECHKPLRAQIEAKRGFHGSAELLGRPCEECHREHAGRDVPPVNWGGPEKSFDHKRAGWPLEGAHGKADCGKCHDWRRIRAQGLRDQLARTPGSRTFLGLETACVFCHFDEHRGQISTDCASCHGLDAWKPAPRFDHEKTTYPLHGAHQKVTCAKCHASLIDPAYSAGAFPAMRAATYLKVKPIAHGECSSCHKDPHAGRLGAACASCHTVESWTQVAKQGTEGAFRHDRARFPLEGRHRVAACADCHPEVSGQMKLTGIAFARCEDCHEDAHAGQIAAAQDSLGCVGCHTVAGYKPARFTLEDHARTRYPLEGGHQAVPCLSCHPSDPSLEKASWKRPPRVFRASSSRLAYGERDLADCATCHVDPHAGQFLTAGGSTAGAAPARACSYCHRVESFRGLKFDHGRDTTYPLRGKHAQTACAFCHSTRKAPLAAQVQLAPWFAAPASGGATVQVATYRGTPSNCEACHSDIHMGQFATSGKTSCAGCHTEDAFKPAPKFDHARSRFALSGAHLRAKCASCHGGVEVVPDRATIRYRPLPLACDGCHEDVHRGAFHIAGSDVSCETCHTTEDWRQVAFSHDQTGFRLGVAHSGVSCTGCHTGGVTKAPSRDCASCHQDPHGGALGTSCGDCHLDAANFRDPGAAAFHERTRLPLLGRHAAIPCESCHIDRSASTWAALDVRCASCHTGDYARTVAGGVDHAAWGFSTTCEDCHDTYRWDLAAFPQHERCFPIRSGSHSGVSCLNCHTSLAPQALGTCSTMTASCTRCHSCNSMNGRHSGVPGYECRDRKCYECHPSGGGGD